MDNTPPSNDDNPKIHDVVSWQDKTTYSKELPTVMKQFAEAGVPRSIRTLQRYCENGHLDAKKYDVELGETWFVNPDSVSTRIAEIKQHAAIASGDVTPSPRQSHDVVTGPNISGEKEFDAPPSNDVGRRQKSDDTERPTENIRERQTTSDADKNNMTLPIAVLDALTGQLEAKDAQIHAKDEQLKEAANMFSKERAGHEASLKILASAMEVITDGKFSMTEIGAGGQEVELGTIPAVETRPVDEVAMEWKEQQENLGQ